jgi:hypothetical protein
MIVILCFSTIHAQILRFKAKNFNVKYSSFQMHMRLEVQKSVAN